MDLYPATDTSPISSMDVVMLYYSAYMQFFALFDPEINIPYYGSEWAEDTKPLRERAKKLWDEGNTEFIEKIQSLTTSTNAVDVFRALERRLCECIVILEKVNGSSDHMDWKQSATNMYINCCSANVIPWTGVRCVGDRLKEKRKWCNDWNTQRRNFVDRPMVTPMVYSTYSATSITNTATIATEETTNTNTDNDNSTTTEANSTTTEETTVATEETTVATEETTNTKTDNDNATTTEANEVATEVTAAEETILSNDSASEVKMTKAMTSFASIDDTNGTESATVSIASNSADNGPISSNENNQLNNVESTIVSDDGSVVI